MLICIIVFHLGGTSTNGLDSPVVVLVYYELVQCSGIAFFIAGVNGFSLSSFPSSEDGHVRVCPGTTLTLTCTASQVLSQGWRDQNGPIDSFTSTSTDDVPTVVQHAPYTLTLVAVDDNGDGDDLADLTSTLEVMVDDITNGTSISCIIFRQRQDLIIYIIGSYFIEVENYYNYYA